MYNNLIVNLSVDFLMNSTNEVCAKHSLKITYNLLYCPVCVESGGAGTLEDQYKLSDLLNGGTSLAGI